MIIDAQNEYAEGALPLAGVGDAVASIWALLDKARQAGAPVIHVVHHGRPGGLFDPQGRNGAVIEKVAPAAGETVVAKTLPNCFTSQAFREALAATGRKKIIAVGFMTHMCVEATTRAAIDHGYSATVVADATATRDLPDPLGGPPVGAADVQRRSLAAMADRFATIVKSAGEIPT
ncbi:MAG TPA: cysteine hydrolase family protein [Beijerinckiaceae bacterium]